MSLSSQAMQLSSSEKHWLPWFGKTGKIALGWSCRLNRSAYPVIEQTFEAIAHTRVQLLHNWTREQWEHLAELAEHLAGDFAHIDSASLLDKLAQAEDFSELFIVAADGAVIASTWGGRAQHPLGKTRALAEVYALMVYHHEDQADAATMPPAAYAAWLAWYDTTPDTPCIAICSTSQGDALCKGCGRTFAEVQHWPEMSPADKRATWRRITAEGTAWRFNRYAERAQERAAPAPLNPPTSAA